MGIGGEEVGHSVGYKAKNEAENQYDGRVQFFKDRFDGLTVFFHSPPLSKGGASFWGIEMLG
jgi:hypothetical protein